MVLLNGRLEVLVVEARGLTNLDKNFFNNSDKSDPYCVVDAEGINGSRRIGKTFTIDDCLNPKWNYKLVADINQDVGALNFTVKDRDKIGSEIIGTCLLDAILFTNTGKMYKGYLHLTSPRGKPSGSLRVQISYSGEGGITDVDENIIERLKLTTQDMKTKFASSSGSVKRYHEYGASEPIFIHGTLDVFLDRAENLMNTDTSILSTFKKNDVSDPYVSILLIDTSNDSWKVATSSVIENDLNPVWKENFSIIVCHDVVAVKFSIKDKDVISSDGIGSVSFMAKDIVKGVNGTIDLKTKSKKKSTLTVSIKYSPASSTSSPEVPNCFYPMRDMNNVTLYQDAHCVGLPITIAAISLHSDPHRRAWLDIYNTIIKAKEFIYIIGWSVNTRISLLRWSGEDTRSLGDILLQKSKEGVQVCIMVWDELTSTDLNKDGAMGTGDQATANFFKDTSVTVVLAARERHSKDKLSTKESFTNFCYSHHQKCVIADEEIYGHYDRRQMVAYVGGLDLTKGRFDTPEHPLFRTLDTDHKYDFSNNICLSNVKYGPREPWHDIHCRIEGPSVMDLFSNFKERWLKQGIPKKTALIQDEDRFRSLMHVPNRWHVQIFRSINSDSAVFPRYSTTGLFIKKERVFENSIHRAYIHHIRRSRKFMYIENQYFMGSSHAWDKYRDTKISNLIPLEIVAHIERKIREGQSYVAYILIPMFPEGKPGDKVIQEILHWQFRTMEMMYRRVGEAIASANIKAHPQDFLLFFCLGNKEGHNPMPVPPDLTGVAASAFANRRLMIYVHSKMAIFDDEYIIIGSANINDRSMSGNRDTEIAIGAFQAEHLVDGDFLPNGDVATFRKSLWCEHMGVEAPLSSDPSFSTTARHVKHLAEEGLLAYIDDRDRPGKRHLLLYPLTVHQSGAIYARDDCPVFPDTTAKVIGSRSGYIPTRLTS